MGNIFPKREYIKVQLLGSTNNSVPSDGGAGAGTRANRARAMMAEQGAQAVDNSGHIPMRQGGRGGQPKRQKNRGVAKNPKARAQKNIGFQIGHPSVEPHIAQTLYMSNKILLPLLGTKTIRYEIQKFRWP